MRSCIEERNIAYRGYKKLEKEVKESRVVLQDQEKELLKLRKTNKDLEGQQMLLEVLKDESMYASFFN